ncbi:MAG: S1 RNA-binding domain-containing protein [Lachnospiraceae bacterium]|nr:S1 RNA-binding domain-containing protein [Lachnospiraceae bacterium]
MIELGKVQKLRVVKLTEFGAYLGENDMEKVLLPKKQVPENAGINTEISVFVYRDSEDRLICTTAAPKLTLGEIGILKVNDVTKIGAFLDWGLEKDLFLSFKEMTTRVEKGKEYAVALYIDKSNRLAATMKVYPYLKLAGDYEKDDEVTGIVYEIHPDFGAYVAVDGQYQGMIQKNEVRDNLKVGDIVNTRVVKVRDDGKLNLSPNKKAYMQMDEDSEKIIKVIMEYDGVLPYNDKASPDIIERDFHMSKAAFKRAVGRLYKSRKIEITEKSIRLL